MYNLPSISIRSKLAEAAETRKLPGSTDGLASTKKVAHAVGDNASLFCMIGGGLPESPDLLCRQEKKGRDKRQIKTDKRLIRNFLLNESPSIIHPSLESSHTPRSVGLLSP